MNHDSLARKLTKYFLPNEPIGEILDLTELKVGMNYYDGENMVKNYMLLCNDLKEIKKVINAFLPEKKRGNSDMFDEHFLSFEKNVSINIGSFKIELNSDTMKFQTFKFLGKFYPVEDNGPNYHNKQRANIELQVQVLKMILWLINDNLKWSSHIYEDGKKAAFKIIFNYYISEVLHIKPISRQKFSEKYEELLTKNTKLP